MAQQEQEFRKVPVLRSDKSFVIEQEFDSIREKFEQEMRRMEEEMSRFRTQVIASERSRMISSQQQQHQQQTSSSQQLSSSSSSSSKTQVSSQQRSLKSTTASSTSTSSAPKQPLPAPSAASRWLNELDSPLIREEQDGAKVLRLRFDVAPYEPEQIVVKTLDNRLMIHAQREEKGPNSSSYREYNREFLLPEGTDPELIRSSLSADGVLTVEAPLPLEAIE